MNFPHLFFVRNFSPSSYSRYNRRGTHAFDIKGVKLARSRSFTLFTATSCMDNNLLFLTSAEDMFNGIIVKLILPTVFTVFLSRIASFIKSAMFESFMMTLPSIVTILCSSQLTLSGTIFRNKYFISKCA